MAGILRLELNQEEGYDYLPLNPENWIPAVSQGALAVECREDDAEVRALLAELNHAQTAMCVRAERAFLSAVEGDCRVPVGASVTADGSSLRIRGFIGSPDGVSFFEGVKMGDGAGEGAEALGQALARELLDAGGAEVLQALRAEA
jgi:hydroxymethylbilane synthase